LCLAETMLEGPKAPSKNNGQIQVHYVDATGQIAGRLCSNSAKRLLNGDRVVIVNAEKCLFSGQRSAVMNAWLEYLKIASVVHPKHGPFHARTPDGMLTRMIRGMVPRRKPKGESAMKRLRVYVGIPKNLESSKFSGFENSKATKPSAYYVELGEIATRIGWKGGPTK
jgi:large subunit ribosomal protein L13